MTAFLIIGPIAFYTGLIAAVVYGVRYRPSRRPGRRVSLLRYVLITLTLGLLAFLVGALAGSAIFCAATAEPGSLCGLGGWLGLGPLCSGLAMLVYARKWSRRAPPAR